MTGHKTVSILLEHYFKPGREDLRRTLVEKMPKLFAMGEAVAPSIAISPKTVQEKLAAMTAENWSKVRDDIVKSLDIGLA